MILTTEKRNSLKKLFHSKMVRLFVVTLISALLVFALTGASISKYSVLINDETAQTIVFTSESSPQVILKQEKIPLGKYDEYNFSGFNNNKATIDILRAHDVTVNADNQTRAVHVASGTVRQALDKLGILVHEDDLINVSLNEVVTADINVTINRVVDKTVTQVEQIPFKTDLFPTNTLKKGKTQILKEGVAGTKTTTIARTLIDGKVVKSQVTDTQIVEPKKARALIGDPSAPTSVLIPAEPIELDKNGNPVSYVKKVRGKATAYSALGRATNLKPGHVAMELNQFPRGTKLYIKTPNSGYIYGYSVVKDTGYAVNSGEILVDLFFGSYAESVAFGAKTVDIYVLQ